jgi:NDP-sugar pyrophosphorylase family protein
MHQTIELLHHVEKPDKIQSEWINCGIYVLSPTFKKTILRASQIKHAKVQTQKERLPFIGQIQTSTDLDPNYLSLEKDVIGPSAG